MSWQTNYRNGYEPNQSAQLEDYILGFVENVLTSELNKRNIDQDIATEAFELIKENLPAICRDIDRNLTDRQGQADTREIENFLLSEDIPKAIDTAYRNLDSRYRSQTRFSSRTFGTRGTAVGIPRRPAMGGGMRVNTSMSAGENGPGRAFINQLRQDDRAARRSDRRDESRRTSSRRARSEEQERALEQAGRIILAGYPDKKFRRKSQISVDKISEDTDSIVYNPEFIENTIQDETKPITQVIDVTTGFDINKTELLVSETPESTEYCKTISKQECAGQGNVVSASSYELEIAVASRQEAINLVKEAVPEFGTQEQWLACIAYNELIAKKIPGLGNEVKEAFKLLAENIDDLRELDDIAKKIVPIMKKQPQEVREYIEALAMDKINKIFRAMLYMPSNPAVYPAVYDWSAIYQLVNPANREGSSYINEMFSLFGDNFTTMVFLCVKNALNDVFRADGELTVIEPEGAGLGLIAKMSSVTAIVGKYRMSDYGHAPEHYLKELKAKFNNDYIVHKYHQEMFVTNVSVQEVIGSSSRYTIIKNIGNLSQYLISALLTAMRQNNEYPQDMSLVEVDKECKYITGVYTVSLGLDNTMMIAKQ